MTRRFANTSRILSSSRTGWRAFAIVFAGSLSLLSYSCTKIDPLPPDGKEYPILFSQPLLGTMTKVQTGILTGAYPTNENFLLWGYYSGSPITATDDPEGYGTEYIPGSICLYRPSGKYWEPVYKTGTDATDSPTGWSGRYYWKGALGYMTFHALSPSEAYSDGKTGILTSPSESSFHQFGNGTDGSGFHFGFAVPSAPDKQFDLLYSDYRYNARRDYYSTGSNYDDMAGDEGKTYTGVDLKFRHALSAVTFKVRAVASYDPLICVKKIEVLYPYSTGEFNENRAKSFSEERPPVWSGQRDEQPSYTIFEGSMEINQTAKSIDGTLLLLPQSLNHMGGGGNVVTVKITLTRDNSQTITTLYGSLASLDGKNSDKETVTIDKWEVGYKYTYIVSIGLQKITFDPYIDTDWANNHGGIIEIE